VRRRAGRRPVTAADNIVKARLAEPFMNIAISNARGRSRRSGGLDLTVKSNFFRIHGDGRANNVMVRIEAFVYRTSIRHAAGRDDRAKRLPLETYRSWTTA